LSKRAIELAFPTVLAANQKNPKIKWRSGVTTI
jgi:hypothetical protein